MDKITNLPEWNSSDSSADIESPQIQKAPLSDESYQLKPCQTEPLMKQFGPINRRPRGRPSRVSKYQLKSDEHSTILPKSSISSLAVSKPIGDILDAIPTLTPLSGVSKQLVHFWFLQLPHLLLSTNENLGRIVGRNLVDICWTPAGLHAVISLSASVRGALQTGDSSCAALAIEHQSLALRHVRERLDSPVDQDVIQAVLLLAVGEGYANNSTESSACILFEAVEGLIKQIGGISKVDNPSLRYQFYINNCLLKDPNAAFYFRNEPMSKRMKHFTHFIHALELKNDERRRRAIQRPSGTLAALIPGSIVYNILTRLVTAEEHDPTDKMEVTVSALHAQLSCLLTLASFWHEKSYIPDLRAKVSELDRMLVTLGFDGEASKSSLFCVMMVADAAGIGDVQGTRRYWHVMKCMNIVRYMGTGVKLNLQKWLLDLLQGIQSASFGRINSFMFSYAS